MPIESAIIKEQKLNRKAMSVPEFRSACRDYARRYMGIQSEGFQRMGVIGDWDHPYATMDPGFEAEEVKVFGEMYKKGYIYKGQMCIRDRIKASLSDFFSLAFSTSSRILDTVDSSQGLVTRTRSKMCIRDSRHTRMVSRSAAGWVR